MKIRIYNPKKHSSMTFRIPTGFLFSKLGLRLLAKSASNQARKEYERKLEAAWRAQGNPDTADPFSPEEQLSERLDPPITEAQAREMFAALNNSKYLLRGLPLISFEAANGFRLRIDL